MKDTIDTVKIRDAIIALIFNFTVNNYAVERVAFGHEKPGDRVPIDVYLQDLHINNITYKPNDIPGTYIDDQERIRTDRSHAEYVREMFVMLMERIFSNALKGVRSVRDNKDLPLPSRFREYLLGLFPLFTEILNVEVEYDSFDVIPTPPEQMTEYSKWKQFVTAILLKQLKSDDRINRYVKDITNAPQYIRRLVEKKGRNFYLKPIDMNGYEYPLALFSLMQFMNGENDKLFGLKMREWERKNII